MRFNYFTVAFLILVVPCFVASASKTFIPVIKIEAKEYPEHLFLSKQAPSATVFTPSGVHNSHFFTNFKNRQQTN